MASEFIEVISEQTKAQIDAIMPLVNELANKIKDINSFKASGTPSGADKNIKGLSDAYKEQAKSIEQVKAGLEKTSAIQKQIEQSSKNQTSSTQKLTKSELDYVSAIERGVKAKEREILANKKLSDAYGQLTTKRNESARALQNLIASEMASNAEIRKAQKEFDILNKKVGQADKAIGKISQANNGLKMLTNSVSNLMSAFGITMGIGLVVDIGKNIYETTKQLQSLDLALKMVSGTTKEFETNQSFISGVAEKWGIEIKGLTEQYTQFYTAAKGIISTEKIKTVFESIAKSGALMGLSVEKQNAAFYAFEQMMSKGVVSAEELKKQLGNAMPGAMKAAGMAYMELHPKIKTIQEAEAALMKEMKNGAIDSATYVPLIVKNFEKLYGIEMVDKVDTLQASQERLSNSWIDLVRSMNESPTGGISKFFSFVLDSANTLMKDLVRLNTSWDELYNKAKSKGIMSGEQQAVERFQQGGGTESGANASIEVARKELLRLKKELLNTQKEGEVLTKKIEKRSAYVATADLLLQVRGDQEILAELKSKKEGLIEDYNIQVGIIRKTKQLKAEIGKTTDTKTLPKGETDAEKKARDKAEKDRLEDIDKHNKDLYDLKMAQLEKDKLILEDGLNNEKLNYSERLGIAFEISVKEMEIAKTRYEEEQRLAKGNDEKLKIADINFWKEKEKLAKDSVKRINEVKYTPQYKDKGKPADAEKFGEGTSILGVGDMQGAIDEWDNLQSKKKKDEEDELARLKAMRDVYNDIFKKFGETTGFEETMNVFAKISKNGNTFWENLTSKKKISELEWQEWGTAVTAIAQDAFNIMKDASEKRFEREYSQLEKQKEIAISFAGDSDSAKKKIEEDYEKRQKEIKKREFKAKKQQAIVDINLATAQAIMMAWVNPGFPGAIALTVALATMGAIQLGIAASQKMPEYWTGTDNAEAGLAWTNERGAELVTDKRGNIKDFGDNKGARLTMMEKGDKVYTAQETKRLMFDNELNSIMMDNGISNAPKVVVNAGISKSDMRDIMIETIGSMGMQSTIIDKNGLQHYVSNGHSKTIFNSNRVSGLGIRV